MLPAGIRRLFRLDRSTQNVEVDVDREIEHHFATAVAELVRQGLTPEAARAEVARRFGDLGATRAALMALSEDRAKTQLRRDSWSSWAVDARHALRSLRRTPGLTGAIVIMLALGIGVNAAMYSMLDKLLVRAPPGVAAPDGILRLYLTGWDRAGSMSPSVSYRQYLAIARGTPAFSEVVAVGTRHYATGPGRETADNAVSIVTGNFFHFSGARPLVGRLLRPDDDQEGASPAAVLSYSYARRQFGSAPAALGNTLTLNGVTYAVVGVTQPDFSGLDWSAIDAWVPALVALPAEGGPGWQVQGSWFLNAFGRLAPGATGSVAAQQATAAWRAEMLAEPRGRLAAVAHVVTGRLMDPVGREGVWGALRLPGVAAGVTVILLLVACANAVVLLLLRATSRRRELAIRAALGAGWWRSGRLLVLEGAALGIGAGLASGAVAAVAAHVLPPILIPPFHWGAPLLDWHTLMVAAAAALVIGLGTGLAPVLARARGATLDDLKVGPRASRRRRRPLQAALLVFQGAMALVLLVGGAVFYRSLTKARGLDFGFDAGHLLAVRLWRVEGRRMVGVPAGPTEAMVQQLRRLPGVVDVAQSDTPFSWWALMVGLGIEGDSSSELRMPTDAAAVTPNFFAVSGIPVVRGRAFLPGEDAGAPKVAIVNGTLARSLWPQIEPLGQCLNIGDSLHVQCATVVGVVQDAGAQSKGLRRYYVPLSQSPLRSGPRTLVIKSHGSPSRLVGPTTRIMESLFSDLPPSHVLALPAMLASQLHGWEVGAGLFGAAAVLAMLLAAAGLYAVVAFGVRQRQHEFGIRRAVGARGWDLAGLVLVDSVVYAVAGMGIGAALAYWGAGLIQPLLFREVRARDPATYLLAALVLLMVCVVATFAPASTATRVDPRAALQAE